MDEQKIKKKKSLNEELVGWKNCIGMTYFVIIVQKSCIYKKNKKKNKDNKIKSAITTPKI